MPPGVACPFRVGVVSSVVWPLVRLLVTVPASSTTEVMEITTDEVSTVNGIDGPIGLVLPALSTAWAANECAPSVSGVVGVKLQAPVVGSALVLPIRLPLS